MSSKASDFEGLVLLFHRAAHPNNAARLHAADCPMVNTAKGKRRVVVIETDPNEIALSFDDLNERQYPVKRCKCCKKKAK